jgi:hypothetical protein
VRRNPVVPPSDVVNLISPLRVASASAPLSAPVPGPTVLAAAAGVKLGLVKQFDIMAGAHCSVCDQIVVLVRTWCTYLQQCLPTHSEMSVTS